MFKINVKKIAVFFTALSMMAVIAVPAITMAYTCADDCNSAALTSAQKTTCQNDKAALGCGSATAGKLDPWGEQSGGIESIGLGATSPSNIAVNIVNVMLGFLGIIAVVIILVGGFKWMTAGGNEDGAAEAKKWIYSGVIGLLIILASYALAKFAITQLMSATGGIAK